MIRPLLLPDSPVVIWWPGKCPANPATDELAQLAGPPAHRCAANTARWLQLKARAQDYQPGDTDLSWTRLTRWRALLAAALDQYPARITGARSRPSEQPVRRSARRLAAVLSEGPGQPRKMHPDRG